MGMEVNVNKPKMMIISNKANNDKINKIKRKN